MKYWKGAALYAGEGGVLNGILGGGVPPGSLNPDPISDQNMPFSAQEACSWSAHTYIADTGEYPLRGMCRSVVNFSRELNSLGG